MSIRTIPLRLDHLGRKGCLPARASFPPESLAFCRREKGRSGGLAGNPEGKDLSGRQKPSDFRKSPEIAAGVEPGGLPHCLLDKYAFLRVKKTPSRAVGPGRQLRWSTDCALGLVGYRESEKAPVDHGLWTH